MKKKFLALLMALAMLISVIPMTVGAEDGEEGGCTHPYTLIQTHMNGTHSTVCSECGVTISGPEACSGNPCGVCGYTYSVEPACEHTSLHYESNGNGTHKKLCGSGCGFRFAEAEACSYNESGVCTLCNYNKPAEAPACKHYRTDCTSTKNGDGTHTVTCKCGHVVDTAEACILHDGTCSLCGYKPKTGCDCNEGMGTHAKYKNDGTHDILCGHEKVVNNVTCTLGSDGKCIGCGRTMCEHKIATDYTWTENGDGTHTVTCRCGYVVDKAEKCDMENGKCKFCHYEKKTEDKPEDKPTRPSDKVDPKLDKVPKTGSFFLEWLYSLIFG